MEAASNLLSTLTTAGEDGERFIAEVRGDEPELAKELRIEERELEAGERN